MKKLKDTPSMLTGAGRSLGGRVSGNQFGFTTTKFVKQKRRCQIVAILQSVSGPETHVCRLCFEVLLASVVPGDVCAVEMDPIAVGSHGYGWNRWKVPGVCFNVSRT